MFAMDPGNPMARLFYVWVLVANGRPDTADTVLRGLSAADRDTVPTQVAQFLADALLHGRQAVAPAAPGVEAVACTSDVFARFLAEAYAMAGVPDRAFHWLDIAITRGYINYPFLARYDPCLQSLRGDARFERLLDTVQARWLAFET
jgi:non-specific serine/threonine protein kinase